VIQLDGLGYGPFFAAQLELLAQPELVAARVVADGRDLFPLAGCAACFGEVSGKLRQSIREGLTDRPVVGDWVAVTEHGDRAVIHHVFDRRTQLRRRAAGSDAHSQTIAANVDVFFVVTAVGRDFNPRRLERYITAVWDSGASPVVVLNKTDLCAEVETLLQSIEASAPTVPIVAVSARVGSGIDALRAQLGRGLTAAFIGSSGVGKSSLVNLLTGEDRQPTAAIGVEGKGRHTTSRRELLALSGGGALIDTPGLREFGIVDAGPGLDVTFADVAEFACRCRFGDCTHADEPGCAVVDAVARGALPAVRLESYQRLRREVAAAEARRNPVLGSNSKKRWKSIRKIQKALLKSDGK
jgi:ribosome biogenesis GTPase / thiamine phosphate phosphatase